MNNNNLKKTKNNDNYKINKLLTLFLSLFAVFTILFILVLGSITDNRFGLHIIFNGDLVSSPLWFNISIYVFVAIFFIFVTTIFILSIFGVIKYNSSFDKKMRLFSMDLIGFSIWFVCLSSYVFASFNWQFFDSQINDGLVFNDGLHISIHGMIIGIFTIITLGLTFIFYLGWLFSNKNISDKSYYNFRNGSIILIAFSWFSFNLSTISFGTMGGDVNVLLAGLTGMEVSELKGEWILLSEASNFWNFMYNNELTINFNGTEFFAWEWGSNGVTGGIIEGGFSTAWNTGLGLPFVPRDAVLLLGNSVKDSKLIYGVNNSVQAFLLFDLTLLTIIFIFVYLIYSNDKYDLNKNSFSFNFSIALIIMTLVFYTFLALISPYIPGDYEFGTILPGPVAAYGESGGIHSAYVYFLPNYLEITSWRIVFLLYFLVPVIMVSIMALFTVESWLMGYGIPLPPFIIEFIYEYYYCYCCCYHYYYY